LNILSHYRHSTTAEPATVDASDCSASPTVPARLTKWRYEVCPHSIETERAAGARDEGEETAERERELDSDGGVDDEVRPVY
jgi:hypothetical protein